MLEKLTQKGRPNKGTTIENVPDRVQSVHRAVMLLKTVAAHTQSGIRLFELCAKLGLKTPTAHLLLTSLLEEGRLLFDRFSKKYYLGLEMIRMGRNAQEYIAINACRPVVEHRARVRLVSLQGERELDVPDFFLGPGKNALEPQVLIHSVSIPIPDGASWGQAFLKLGRRKAMASAVDRGLGLELRHIPLTPDRVLEALQQARSLKRSSGL